MPIVWEAIAFLSRFFAECHHKPRNPTRTGSLHPKLRSSPTPLTCELHERLIAIVRDRESDRAVCTNKGSGLEMDRGGSSPNRAPPEQEMETNPTPRRPAS